MANRKSSSGAVVWLMFVVGLLLAGGWALWSQDTRRGNQHPEYSVHRTDDRGSAIVYRLYQSAGLAPKVWDQDFTRLKEPGLILIIAPAKKQYILREMVEVGARGDILPHELEALDRWVREGNVAVVLTREMNPVYHAVGLITDEPKGLSGDPAVPTQPSVLARGVSKLETHTQFGFKYGRQKGALAKMADTSEPEPPVEPVPAEEWLELFVKKQGTRTVSQVVSASRGKGLYVAVNDMYPAGNLGITTADNARFMLNLAGLMPLGGTIWFDEYHKRDVERGFMAYLRDRALVPVLAYLLLFLLLVFWRTGSRFGPVEPLVVDQRRDSAEYIRAAAQLYKNAGMNREALAGIFSDFRRRMAGALRIDGLTDLDEVGRRYERKTGRPALEARTVLIQTEAALARERLEPAEALRFCADLTRLDEALHQPSPDRKG